MIQFTLASLERMQPSRPPGYVEDVVASGEPVLAADGSAYAVRLTREAFDALVAKYDPTRQPSCIRKATTPQVAERAPVATPSGPGTELTKLLARFGITYTPDCSCRSMAARMDAWGCDEADRPERIEEVLGVMRGEAAKRGLPWLDAAGRVLIRRAIANARKDDRGNSGSPLPPQR